MDSLGRDLTFQLGKLAEGSPLGMVGIPSAVLKRMEDYIAL